MSSKMAYRKKHQNKMSMLLVCAVVLLLMVVVLYKSIELKQKVEDFSVKEAQLKSQIEEEMARSEEIEEYRVYTQTKAFYEEVAKEKLGLVYEGEIIFKQE